MIEFQNVNKPDKTNIILHDKIQTFKQNIYCTCQSVRVAKLESMNEHGYADIL